MTANRALFNRAILRNDTDSALYILKHHTPDIVTHHNNYVIKELCHAIRTRNYKIVKGLLECKALNYSHTYRPMSDACRNVLGAEIDDRIIRLLLNHGAEYRHERYAQHVFKECIKEIFNNIEILPEVLETIIITYI